MSMRNLQLLIWLFKTQQNGRGPRRYCGLDIVDWFLLILLCLVGFLGLWVMFKFYVSLHSMLLPRFLSR